MHIGTKLKRIDFTYLLCVLTFWTTWYPSIGAQFRAIRTQIRAIGAQFKKCTGTTDICLPNVDIQ